MTLQDVFAVIDVGSNTIRMLVARFTGQDLVPVDDRSEFVRLGAGVDATGALASERMDAALEAIEGMSAEARRVGVRQTVGIATSAVRDASNGAAFLDRVRASTGVDVRIIDGEEEARLTALGATMDLDMARAALVCDLGGGSAEVVFVENGALTWGRSVKLGSGRMSERFVTADPPLEQDLARLRDYVRECMQQLPAAWADVAVLTGGTATQIARIAGLTGAVVHFSAHKLESVRDLVVGSTAAVLVNRYGIRPERAQVLPAGVAALTAIVQFYELEDVVVTQHGIREGALIDVLQKEGMWPSRPT